MTPALKPNARMPSHLSPLLQLMPPALLASRQGLTEKSVSCEKEVAAVKEKLTHVAAASEKVEADFNEFVKSHMVAAPS